MTYRTLSLGAGVQSSTLALMSAHGDVDPLDSVIFADTQNETAETYAWLDTLEWLLNDKGMTVNRTTTGNLLADHLAAVKRVSQAPLFIRNQAGEKGRIARRCSRDYKVYPVRRVARRLMLESGERKMEQWVGISWDESERINNSKAPKYITTRWPLIELRMTKRDCLQWMAEHGYPRPPRSACYWCPQASDERWVTMRDHQPDEFAKACAADEALRAHGVPGIDSQVYLHGSLLPLSEAPIDVVDDGQGVLFDDPDCEGGCFL